MSARDTLLKARAIERLRERDASLFAEDFDARMRVMQRLGWTDLAHKAPERFPLLRTLAHGLVAEGATDVLLLGMGGSSLAPLVMERVIGGAPGMPRLHVVDTTSPGQVAALLQSLDPSGTFVIVASKSGTTIESLSLYAIVREWLEAAGMSRPAAGRRCIAITDPGSPLEDLRKRDLMRMAVTAPAAVGGRYSALTVFGLVPAALIGIDLPELVSRAQAMETACGSADENPAAHLAAWMADSHAAGRDKLTLVCSERLRPFGLWAEQLVAESLGKNGTGLVPVIEHDLSTLEGYGEDRAVVVLRFADDGPLASFAEQARRSHPVFESLLADPLDLGAEFVRWEHAVALAGFLLGVNPFDEPNVTEAKQATSAILQGGAREVPSAQFDLSGTWVTFAGALAVPASPPHDRAAALREAVSAAAPGDYLAVLLYAPDDPVLIAPLERASARLSRASGRPVCLELGPRYLHSTGQLHKGGPNTGVYVLVTARERTDLAIPGQPFTLRALHRAQAEGDLVTLARHGRRIVRLDLPAADLASLTALANDLEAAGA